MLDIISKENFIQFIKFGIIGAIGTLLNLSILYLLTEFCGVYYILSEIIAFIISVINNYVLNKKFTFKENIDDRWLTLLIKYALVCLVSLIINLVILFFLVEFFEFWYIIAEIIAILCSFIINFIGNKYWTFKERSS